MIAYINGEVLSVGADHLVVLTSSGMGFKLFVTQAMRIQVRPGQKISLHTYLVVREDSLSLFGFDNDQDRDYFTLLLGVNGIGPRIALAILSSLSVDAIRRAVLSEQAEVFSRVPGVGKKNAQKILLHLQGRVGGDASLLASLQIDANITILEALTGLGYSIVEAQAAIQSLPKDAPEEEEERLRLALKYFAA